MNTIPALDGLRAVAVMLVLMDHVWQSVFGYFHPGQDFTNSPLYYGKAGVQLFFVLSGFLLFLPYAEWLFGQRARPSALLFYKRRALRVGPAYWISLLILTAAAPLSLAAFKDLAVHAVFLSNTSWRTVLSIDGVYWTMAIEVQFYVLLPLIGWLIHALAQKMRLRYAAGFVLLLLLLVSLSSHVLGDKGSIMALPLVTPFLVGYHALSYWLAVFGCGILCSLAFIYLTRIVKLSQQKTRWLRRTCTWSFSLGIVLAFALACIPALQHFSGTDLLFGLAAGGFLFGVVLGSDHLRRPFASAPMRFLGLISYSFYIWHNIVVGILAPRLRALSFAQQWLALFAIGLVVSTLVAYLSYQVSERPFIQARKKAHESQGIAQQAHAQG
jgi:peptidoglycan/LPS O-acetylase OafA/YrhL